MFVLPPFRIVPFMGAVWAMFAYATIAQIMASLFPTFFREGQKGGGCPKPNQYAGEPSDRICVWR